MTKDKLPKTIRIAQTGFNQQIVFAMTEMEFINFCVDNKILSEIDANKGYNEIIMPAKQRELEQKSEHKEATTSAKKVAKQ